MKGPQKLVTLVETAGKFYKHRHACKDHCQKILESGSEQDH